MPSADADKTKIQESWAEQMDDDEPVEEPERQVEVHGTLKVVTDVTFVDERKCKVIRHYRIGKRKVTRAVAQRKTWHKFGQSANDDAGPNLATTIIAEEVKMEFLLQKEDDESQPQESQEPVNNFGGNQAVTCRNCGLNHWTLHCPYKNQFNALNKLNEAADAKADQGLGGLRKPGLGGTLGAALKGRLGEIPGAGRSKDENNTIRITNLPEETQDSDIRDLFKDFGRITRIFLAKDKATGNSKGFAFVSFEMREQAMRAIKTVNGHGYNNLILSVEWARPSAT